MTTRFASLAAVVSGLATARLPTVRTMRWSVVAALSIAVGAVGAVVGCLFLLDFFGPVVLLPLSLSSFAWVGLLLALHRPRHPVGWLFLVAGTGWLLWFALPAYAWQALVEAPGSLPGGGLAAWLAQLILLPAGCTVLAVMLFPTGRLPSPIWAPAIGMVIALVAAGVAVTALAPEPVTLQRPWVEASAAEEPVATPNPFGVGGSLGDALLAVEPILGVVTGVPLVLVVFAAPAFRLVRAAEVERLQLKWFAYAATLPVVLIVLGFASPMSTVGKLAWGAGMVALGFIPIAAAIAIVRHRLLDIDVLISRSLAYAVLSGGVVALYLVAATLLGSVLHQPEHALASVAAAVLVAILLSPLRARVQRSVYRVLYGDRDEPYAAVRELGRRLSAAMAPDSVLPAVAGTVATSLRLPYVGIELSSGDGDRLVASHGSPGGSTVRLPLVYQQETVGHLLASPRRGEHALDRHDRRVLEALAGQAGPAAHAVRLTTELRRARERLVVAREEERRRLLRDLHDELGPRLGSHALLVDAVRFAHRRDAERADALLAGLAEELQRSVAEVRRIARGLRPSELDQLGLADALRAAAAESCSLAVEMDVSAVGSISPAVETAAYHVGREALANVARHADARWCAVRLHADGAILVLEVHDDGRGVAPGTPPGVGLRSMRERAEELGGRCSITERPGGGTRVRAEFPLGETPS